MSLADGKATRNKYNTIQESLQSQTKCNNNESLGIRNHATFPTCAELVVIDPALDDGLKLGAEVCDMESLLVYDGRGGMGAGRAVPSEAV